MKVRGAKSGYRKTIKLRRELRRNATHAEQLFWSKVVGRAFRNLKFRQQHGIGSYIVDFYCPEKRLVIEIDGDTHADGNQMRYDEQRTKNLNAMGYTVVRYTNLDILTNLDGVFADLETRLNLL